MQKLNQIKVLCDKDGCPKKQQVMTYKRFCSFHPIECFKKKELCPNGCGVTINIDNHKVHLAECRMALVICKQCGASIKRHREKKHYDSICPRRKLICPECSQKFDGIETLKKHQQVCIQTELPTKKDKIPSPSVSPQSGRISPGGSPRISPGSGAVPSSNAQFEAGLIMSNPGLAAKFGSLQGLKQKTFLEFKNIKLGQFLANTVSKKYDQNRQAILH